MMFTPKKKRISNYDKENQRTPIKGRVGECVVCGKNGSDQRVIQSKAGNSKELGRIIYDYLGLTVRSGSLCRSCEGRLITIDKRVASIQSTYDSNTKATKRCKQFTPVKDQKKKTTCLTPKGSNATVDESESHDVKLQAPTPISKDPPVVTPTTSHDRVTKKKLFSTSTTPLRQILPKRNIPGQHISSSSSPGALPDLEDSGYDAGGSPLAPFKCAQSGINALSTPVIPVGVSHCGRGHIPSPAVTPVRPSPAVTLVRPSPVVTPVRPSPVVTPIRPSPAVTPVRPSSKVTTIRPSPAVTPVRPSPVVTLITPSPAVTPVRPSSKVTTIRPSPAVTPIRPSPAVTPVRPNPAVTPVRPSPAVTPVRPSPVVTLVTLSPAVTPIRPSPVVTPVRPSSKVPTIRPSPAVTPIRPNPVVTPVRPSSKVTIIRPSPAVTPIRPSPVVTLVRPSSKVTTIRPSPVVTPVRPSPAVTPVRPSPKVTPVRQSTGKPKRQKRGNSSIPAWPALSHVQVTPSVNDHGYSASPVLPAVSANMINLAAKLQKGLGKISSDTRTENELGLKQLSHRKNGYISALMTNRKLAAFDMLVNFSWEEVCLEAVDKFPSLLSLLVNLMLPERDQKSPSALAAIVPRLGMVYALIVQCRNPDLSMVQRLMSTVLSDGLAPVQLYDRLSKVGVCLSYNNSSQLVDKINGNFNTKLIDAIKSGKQIRLVGDNINFNVIVRDERKDRHSKMNHYFGSAILIRELSFPDLIINEPQMLPHQITAADLLPDPNEIDCLIEDYAYLAMKVAANKIPFFSYLLKDLPTHLTDQYTAQLTKKTIVVPLPVIARNEQYEGDVIEILRQYVRVLREAYAQAGIPADQIPKIHVGGDQLTRERFSGAKRNIIGRHNLHEGFEILSPVSSEFFHMAMNFLQVPFDRHWHAKGDGEIGTLKATQSRLHLNEVKPNVKKHYSADREFFISFVDAHICELVCTHFQMADINSAPTANVPPENLSFAWAQAEFIKLIKKNVGTFIHRPDDPAEVNLPEAPQPIPQPVGEDLPDFFDLPLPGGGETRVFIDVLEPEQPMNPGRPDANPRQSDHVQHYASQILELGLVFKNFLESIKVPNRARMIRTLKVMMVLFKAHNWRSKYADEILRFLIHQLGILSEHDAHMMFYSMFVNTKGRINTNIPCDLQMEYLVCVCKKHIKHMLSNKTEENIEKRTGALAAMNDILENYDTETNTIRRNKRHSAPSKTEDEMCMIEDLREVRPFDTHANRAHGHFQGLHDSLLGLLDYGEFLKWMSRRTSIHAVNLGN